MVPFTITIPTAIANTIIMTIITSTGNSERPTIANNTITTACTITKTIDAIIKKQTQYQQKHRLTPLHNALLQFPHV